MLSDDISLHVVKRPTRSGPNTVLLVSVSKTEAFDVSCSIIRLFSLFFTVASTREHEGPQICGSRSGVGAILYLVLEDELNAR